MIWPTRPLVRRWMESLLHIHDSPRRTAAAFAVGVFFSFSPLLGLHTVLALVVAFAFNLNRVAVVLGACTNVPWLIAPYYTLTTMAAGKALGVDPPPQFTRHLAGVFERSPLTREFWATLGALGAPLILPFTIGSLAGALVLATVAFVVARPFIEARRRHLRLHRHPREAPRCK